MEAYGHRSHLKHFSPSCDLLWIWKKNKMEYRLNIVLEKLSVVTLDVLRKLPYLINNKFTLYIRKGPLHSEKI